MMESLTNDIVEKARAVIDEVGVNTVGLSYWRSLFCSVVRYICVCIIVIIGHVRNFSCVFFISVTAISTTIRDTGRVPVEGKLSVCLICKKYRIILLIIIIISLGQI